jgi:hypothetical protein
VRVVAKSLVLIAIVSFALPIFSAAASARNVRGSLAWCKHHPKSALPACRKDGGGPPSSLTMTASPDPIVETGESDVYVVFSVAAGPTDAEQTVEIDSAGLADRCRQGSDWITDQGSFTGSTASATIDDDGNATFTFFGASCAAGSASVTADVEAGNNQTDTTTIVIDPPEPLIGGRAGDGRTA